MFSNLSLVAIIEVFVCIILSMSIHEMMHAFTGHALGDTTAKEQGRLTLNPLKHIDIFTTVLLPIVLILVGARPFFAARPVPFNPDRVKHGEWGAALIAVAGPLTNLALAILAGSIVRLGLTDGSAAIRSFLILLAEVNIGFFVFNMIPFPPLDGSRVLYAVAPEPVQEIMRRIEYMGFSAILLFMFLLYPILAPSISNVSGILLHLILPGLF